MSNRREFLLGTAGTLALGGVGLGGIRVAAADETGKGVASKSLRALIIGGTGFVGSYHVHAAVARGHKVTVFDRGPKKMDLPAEAEVLVGDRYKDLKLIENGDWDAVIDLAAFGPIGVRSLGEALKGRVGHYTLISTVAAYEHPKAGGTLNESSPLLEYRGKEDPYSLTGPRDVHEYGSLKVLCERETEKQFADKTLILRPGYIAGPGESQGQFAYWSLRMEKGGEVLAAGDPSTPAQFIDVRDLADWCIRLVEKRTTGIYNATGPAAPMGLSRLIDDARGATAKPAKITWVPPSWLAAQKDREMWDKLLYWSLEPGNWGWAMRMNIDRALASGLRFRPMSVTRTDAFNAFRQQPAERQAALLSMRRKKADGSGFDNEAVPWPVYLGREKEILAAWHAQQRK